MLQFLGGEGSSFRLDQDSAGRFISQLTVRPILTSDDDDDDYHYHDYDYDYDDDDGDDYDNDDDNIDQ